MRVHKRNSNKKSSIQNQAWDYVFNHRSKSRSIVILGYLSSLTERCSRLKQTCRSYIEQHCLTTSESETDKNANESRIGTETETLLGLFRWPALYWVCVAVTAIISYGVILTNPTFGPDDAHLMGEAGGHLGYFLLQQGRWGELLLSWLVDSDFLTPFWRDFLGLLFMAFGMTALCGLFRIYSNKAFTEHAATIFTSVSISFPLIAPLFLFTAATISLGSVMTLVAISLYFACKWVIGNKSWTYSLASIALLGYAGAFFESAFPYFLSAGFAIVFLHVLFQSMEYADLHRLTMVVLKFMGICAGALLVFRIGAPIMRFLVDYHTTHIYQKLMIFYDTSSINAFLNSFSNFMVSFFNHRILPFNTATGTFPDTAIYVASISIIVLGGILAFILNKIGILLISLFLVGSSYSLLIVMGTPLPATIRVMFTFSVLIGFIASLVFLLLKNINIRKFKVRYLAVFAIIIFTLTQTREISHTFHLDYLRYQKDVMIMHDIMRELEGLDSLPIVLVGQVPNPLPIRELAGLSMWNWGQQHWFLHYHGFTNVSFANRDQLDMELVNYQAAQMQMWPAYGFVQAFDEYIIVRLGP